MTFLIKRLQSAVRNPATQNFHNEPNDVRALLSRVREATATRATVAEIPIVAGKNCVTEFRAPVKRGDYQFLAADLEILETPPSPVRIALILIIAALFVIAVAWSWFGSLEIVAVAQGKIQPAGRVKLIQPLDAGKIVAIKVENGRHVISGDALIELDPSEALAELADARGAFNAYRAEATRRLVAQDAAKKRRIDQIPSVTWAADLPKAVRQREEAVLDSDLRQLMAISADYEAQIRQKQIERERAVETMASQNQLISTLQERVDMRSALVKSGSGAKAGLIDAQETLDYHKTQLTLQKGQRDAAQANIDVLDREREKAYSAFLADNSQKMSEAQRQADDWQEKLAKVKLKIARLTLRAPIDGIVDGLSVHTIGQVVAGGEEILRIVPDNVPPEIECYLANRDVGFVRPGQTAVVKIESFPFTRYGTLSAKVLRVSGDAISESEAEQREREAAHLNKEKFFGGGQRTQNLVFPVTLVPTNRDIRIDGQIVALKPGMAVTVEITTGNRRILEYLFSPLVETASQAMKER